MCLMHHACNMMHHVQHITEVLFILSVIMEMKWCVTSLGGVRVPSTSNKHSTLLSAGKLLPLSMPKYAGINSDFKSINDSINQ